MAAEHTAEFLNTIHKDNDTSYITIATLSKKEKWNQYHYRGKNEAIQKAIELTNSKVNVYHSNNSFYKPQRGKATLYNINALYIDLDCHEHEFNLDQALFWLKSEKITQIHVYVILYLMKYIKCLILQVSSLNT